MEEQGEGKRWWSISEDIVAIFTVQKSKGEREYKQPRLPSFLIFQARMKTSGRERSCEQDQGLGVYSFLLQQFVSFGHLFMLQQQDVRADFIYTEIFPY